MKFIIGNNDRHESVMVNPSHIIMIKPNYDNNCNSTRIFTIRGIIDMDRKFENILSELIKED